MVVFLPVVFTSFITGENVPDAPKPRDYLIIHALLITYFNNVVWFCFCTVLNFLVNDFSFFQILLRKAFLFSEWTS